MTKAELIEGEAADLADACAAAERSFQRGDIVRARAEAEQLLGKARARGDRALEARVLLLFGELDYDYLAYGRSLAAIEQAVAIRRELFGEEELATRYAYACRALVLISEDRLDEADADLARAIPPGGVPETKEDAARHARFWVALGSTFEARKRIAESRRIFEALLAAAEDDDAFDPLALANVCLHFGSLLEEAGESARANELQLRMLDIRRREIGTPSMRVALGLVGLGMAHIQEGRLDDARAVFHESAAMLKASGHEAHPRASIIYLGLAVVDLMSDRGPASERWIVRALEIEERTFGSTHPNNASMMLTAAQMFASRGYHGRAADLAQRAAASLLPRVRVRADAFEKAVGQAYLSLRHLKRHDAILRWIEPLLASLERLDPPPEHSVAPVLNMLGEAYMTAGKLAKAEAALRRSLKLAERLYGAESEQMQVLYTNLAGLLKKQKRTAEARDAEERAQRIADTLEERASSPFASRWRRGLA